MIIGDLHEDDGIICASRERATDYQRPRRPILGCKGEGGFNPRQWQSLATGGGARRRGRQERESGKQRAGRRGDGDERGGEERGTRDGEAGTSVRLTRVRSQSIREGKSVGLILPRPNSQGIQRPSLRTSSGFSLGVSVMFRRSIRLRR
ncbi:hypothetical protein M758_2G182800 [Ceratodon purpureus]|nr:hypothetical protein M758_2G182800 [Ceratodon purpureus]